MIEFRDVYNIEEAADILYLLLEERPPEANISHSVMPTYEEHLEFFYSRKYWVWFLIFNDDTCIGTINVTKRNEVGIQLFRSQHGRGYGRVALQKLIAEIHPRPAEPGERVGHFIANISPDNKSSIYLFEHIGFEHIQNTYEMKNEP